MKRPKSLFFAAFIKVRNLLTLAVISIMGIHAKLKRNPFWCSVWPIIIFFATITVTAILNAYFKTAFERPHIT